VHGHVTPSYEQKTFADAEKQGRLRLIASPDGASGSVSLHADARLYAGLFDAGQSATLSLQPGRKAYVFLVRGQLTVNGHLLGQGDAAMLADEVAVQLTDAVGAEVLLFDLCA
jgi:redox-sensitive bicupin YhaK (pirin superfamily)